MKIYQYTNIEALAYILKNRTMRFNRLDKVDDLEEGNIESLGVKFCKYIFVSCWTESEEESIPLWKMYGGDKGGVRIGLEQQMFQEYLIDNNTLHGVEIQGAILHKIPPQDMTNPDFFFLPTMNYDNSMFYRHIEYVDDVGAMTKDAISITNIENGRGNMSIATQQFGSYKHKRWEFQNESRFVLCALPINPLLEGANPEIASLVSRCLLSNRHLPFEHYDMRLKDDMLNSIEITLSPSSTDAQRIIIESLVAQYATNATIKESALGRLIRLK